MAYLFCPGHVVGLALPGAAVGVAVVEEAWSVVGHCCSWVWVGYGGNLYSQVLQGENFTLCEIKKYRRRNRNNIEQVDKK